MQSDSIVIAFDVTEDFRAGIFNRFKDAVFHQFRFESGKEADRIGRYHNNYLFSTLIAEIRRYKVAFDIRPPHMGCLDPCE